MRPCLPAIGLLAATIEHAVAAPQSHRRALRGASTTHAHTSHSLSFKNRNAVSNADETPTLCNGIAGACHLHFPDMTFVGAHNAGGSNFQCLATGFLDNTCNLGALIDPTCSYNNQASSLAALLTMGVRWLDMAFLGYNPRDPAQAYTGHNSKSTWGGIAYGDSARAVFDDVGTFLDANSREVVVLWIKRGELDDALKKSDGPNGYNAFFESLRSSKAGKYLYGTPPGWVWPKIGDMVASNKRLVVAGWDKIPSDVGIGNNEAFSTCTKGYPVVLEEILPFNGVCVQQRVIANVNPNYGKVVTMCEQENATVLAVLLDYIKAGDLVFDIVNDHIKTKASKLK
ncbi:hypothetical protein BC830DRAFT_38693 [Chytriomyces sp. MP71]|nr:hypothetical protein BC830DRAFT_38693 [Chytriomyces sp. MP71]